MTVPVEQRDREMHVRCPVCSEWERATDARVPDHPSGPRAIPCEGSGRTFELEDGFDFNRDVQYLTLALIARPAESPHAVSDELSQWLPLARHLPGWEHTSPAEQKATLRTLDRCLRYHLEVTLRLASENVGTTHAKLLRLVADEIEIPF